jgi:hypothetical protein
VREAIATRGLHRPRVVVVDHGGPSAVSAEVRNQTARAASQLLGDEVSAVAAASMEGEEHAHNHPLLADQLRTDGWNRGDIVVAPLFLSPGRHAGPDGDVAEIIRAAEHATAGTLRVHMAGLIGTHRIGHRRTDHRPPPASQHLLPFLMSQNAPTTPATKPLHKNEHLKSESNFLRGNILRDLADQSTGSITEDSAQLTKFHGIYAQDDRDLRNQRRKEGREKAFSFMARVRVPGGVCTPAQWIALDALADQHANGTLKLTTRQAFQFHGILKGDLWRTINGVNRALLDTIAACGDVNRNVMCNPNPEHSALHAEVYAVANSISAHLLPRSRAYHELWVGDELVAGGEPENEPIYGKTYLPRKFKIAVAVPPSNDVDIFSNDLGYIAIVEGGKLVGFNVTVGGGLGMSHNQLETFPRGRRHGLLHRRPGCSRGRTRHHHAARFRRPH